MSRKDDVKTYLLKCPKKTWEDLRKKMKRDKSINSLLVDLIQKYIASEEG